MDQRPSFVLILTDDQDVVLEGMRPMQHTKMLVAEQGLTLTNAFVASPLCCPSRYFSKPMLKFFIVHKVGLLAA